MLIHAAGLAIEDAAVAELGRFNKCLSAMVMTSLAVEALINAVGARVVDDWPAFEKLRPYEKIDRVIGSSTFSAMTRRNPGQP